MPLPIIAEEVGGNGFVRRGERDEQRDHSWCCEDVYVQVHFSKSLLSGYCDERLTRAAQDSEKRKGRGRLADHSERQVESEGRQKG